MRNNQPITQREVEMTENSVIVSRTDEKGKIAFVNDDFLAIAGFTEAELIGQPHNIIRHPDMPTQAFEDMWRDLKAGQPWSGYVKNRVKNGDHYWVHANVMPLMKDGRHSGYISIRRKPDAAVVKALEPAYRQIREGKAADLAISHGRLLTNTRSARLSRWFERLGNKTRVVAVALGLVIGVVGAVGMVVADRATEALRTVYEDRTVPSGQLAEINSIMYSVMLHLSMISGGKEEAAPLVKEIQEDIPKAEAIWKAYLATYLTPEEKVLADRYAIERKEFLDKAVTPGIQLASAGKNSELAALLAARHKEFDQVEGTLGKLIALQQDVAKAEYAAAKQGSMIGFWINLALILMGLVAAFIASGYLQKILNRRLSYLDERLTSIASGNYRTQIAVSDDELQNIMITTQALQAKLAYAEAEKQAIERQKVAMQDKMAQDFDQSVKGIVNLVAAAATELSHSASGMVETATASARRATDATGAAHGATTNVQAVAAAAEELSSSVTEISLQLQKTTQLVNVSRERARNADNLANALTMASDKVGHAMQMISSISGQINLLALNATIESARAGEAGRGFAVVAGEVKNLANQTDRTVADIQTIVEEMRTASNAIVAALREIGDSVDSISEAASSVASAVEEQSATTNEIARNMQNAAIGTQTISDNLEEVKAASNQAGTASEEILQASRELSVQAENLNGEVDQFLKRVRAA